MNTGEKVQVSVETLRPECHRINPLEDAYKILTGRESQHVQVVVQTVGLDAGLGDVPSTDADVIALAENGWRFSVRFDDEDTSPICVTATHCL